MNFPLFFTLLFPFGWALTDFFWMVDKDDFKLWPKSYKLKVISLFVGIAYLLSPLLYYALTIDENKPHTWNGFVLLVVYVITLVPIYAVVLLKFEDYVSIKVNLAALRVKAKSKPHPLFIFTSATFLFLIFLSSFYMDFIQKSQLQLAPYLFATLLGLPFGIFIARDSSRNYDWKNLKPFKNKSKPNNALIFSIAMFGIFLIRSISHYTHGKFSEVYIISPIRSGTLIMVFYTYYQLLMYHKRPLTNCIAIFDRKPKHNKTRMKMKR